MRVKAIWILCALALGGVGFATAGCGGGKTTATETVTVAADTTTEATTTETEATTTTETETETTDTETTATESTDTTETEATGTETTDTTDTTGLSFLSSEKCQNYLRLLSSYATARSGAGGTDTKAAADALQDVADQAPDEIKDDFQTLADAYGKIADALGDTDLSAGQTPPPDVLAKLADVSKEIDSTKVAQASTNISTWLTKNCTGG